MKLVTIATPDRVGERMAGPGIRAWHFAAELSKRFEVTLVAQLAETESSGFRQVKWGSSEGVTAMEAADVLVAQPHRKVLAINHPRAIYDLFDPVVLELDELLRVRPSFRLKMHRSVEWGRLGVALKNGWRLIAAAPRQRDFYLGVHASRGGDVEGWSERWLEVPFGADPGVTEPSKLEPGPPLFVWSGGSWEWLDPQLAVEAIEKVVAGGTPARLLFLGGAHPNPEVGGRVGVSGEASEGIVIRNPEWVPYRERGRWIAGARAAMMLHRETAEAGVSIRTRLFDAIAFGIPVIASRGGWAADLVEREGLGLVVEPGSSDSVTAAMRRMIEDDAFHAACVEHTERVRPRFAWSEVVAPLAEAIAEA
ncbi:MAG: glycosyltransferase [Acidobacteria bacterium]|nr:glycosyltransferase [Acidobacteriota bacterium]